MSVGHTAPITRSLAAEARGITETEYPLYLCLMVTLVVFSFYVYGWMIPGFSLSKDLLLMAVGGLALMDACFRPRRWQFNHVDLFVGILFLYLLAQLIHTVVRIESWPIAYLGFRLDFMPIVLYFGFRCISHERYLRNLHRLFMALLIIGCVLTLAELMLTWTGLVSADFFFEILRNPNEQRRGLTLGIIPRVFGITGTPNITGIYHLVLLALLLFLPGLTRVTSRRASGDRRRRWGIILAILLAVSATILSTSKTAWVILPVLLAVAVLAQRRVTFRAGMVGLIMLVLLLPLTVVSEEQQEYVVGGVEAVTDVYKTLLFDWTEDVLRESPAYGYGYNYEVEGSPYEGITIPSTNTPVAGDIFFAELLRMFGWIGLFLFAVVFVLVPLRIVFSHRCSHVGKGAALGVLAIGLAFIHYDPLTAPVVSTAAWYLMACMSCEWSMSGRVREARRIIGDSPLREAMLE